MTWPVITLWLAVFFYIGVIMVIVNCLLLKRCFGVDEHAMIPGDERLVKAKEE